jgi:hypothetical protein
LLHNFDPDLGLTFLNERWSQSREQKGIVWVPEGVAGEVSRDMEGRVGIGSEVLLKELGWKTGKGNGSGRMKQGSREEKEEAKAERKKFKKAKPEKKESEKRG